MQRRYVSALAPQLEPVSILAYFVSHVGVIHWLGVRWLAQRCWLSCLEPSLFPAKALAQRPCAKPISLL